MKSDFLYLMFELVLKLLFRQKRLKGLCGTQVDEYYTRID